MAHREPYNVLCIDGGGIRGVIPAVELLHIERLLREKHRKSLLDYFSMIAGTSTGAILAAGIAAGVDIGTLLALYENKGRAIFPYRHRWSPRRIGLLFKYGISAPMYSASVLTHTLQETLGKTTVGEVDERVRLLIPFYDTQRHAALFFKSYAAHAEDAHRFVNVPLWEAVLCSSSAPTYFPAHRLEVDGDVYSAVDGGVAANNPVACALADAYKQTRSLRRIRILSLGTGSKTRSVPIEKAREWGAVEWAIPIIDVLMAASVDVYRYIAQTMLNGKNFMRLQFRLSSSEWGVAPLSDDIDDASPENLASLKAATQAYLATEAGERLAEFL